MTAKFGPAGGSDSFLSEKKHATVDAPAWLHARGLNALEVQFGRGVSMGEKTAKLLGEHAAAYDIALSVHSPYYISLSNLDAKEKNLQYIKQSAGAADWMGASKVIVHTGATKGMTREQALDNAAETLTTALAMLDELNLSHITLCPETMGKINQLGTLTEVLDLCVRLPQLAPCVDFGHLYARTLGNLTTETQFAAILSEIESAIGLDKARLLHCHFSQIQYTTGGEYKHLTFGNGEFGPDFTPLAKLFAQRGYTPTVICESAGTQAEDAITMKTLYEENLS
ncbi:MAG: TIM barrel protein [Oscillospiraceae bacterium]|nr:TIM barrel protein [Oscillospiraceae bacterium]